MPHRASFNIDDLRLVSTATHQPVIVGDFVRLASGSPLGVVSACRQDVASVSWLTGDGQRSTLPAVCLRPIA
jgi:hypothetical protein